MLDLVKDWLDHPVTLVLVGVLMFAAQLEEAIAAAKVKDADA